MKTMHELRIEPSRAATREMERDQAADAQAQASAAHEIARAAYLRAEADVTDALREETPLIGNGHLADREVNAVKAALRAVGREVRVEHWPGMRYRVAPTDAGAERIARARSAEAVAKARYLDAVEALQVADAIVAAIDAEDAAERGETAAVDPIAAAVVETMTMIDAIDASLARVA